MAYAIIDRRTAKLVKVALRKGDLKGIKGLIIDTKRIDELDPQEVLQAYRALKKDPEFKARVTPKLREELAESLEQKAQRANFSRSTAESPVATVWALCDKMKGKPRKEIIQTAVEAGVTEGTAKTQYQYWKTWSESQNSGKKAQNH